MKKFSRSVLCAGVIALACITPKVFAGEKANVVVSDSAGKVLVIKTVTCTSGSSTVASGLGTPTHALFTLTSNSGTSTGTKYSISGTNVVFTIIDPVTGLATTTNGSGTGFIWGTP